MFWRILVFIVTRIIVFEIGLNAKLPHMFAWREARWLREQFSESGAGGTPAEWFHSGSAQHRQSSSL